MYSVYESKISEELLHSLFWHVTFIFLHSAPDLILQTWLCNEAWSSNMQYFSNTLRFYIIDWPL